METAAKNVLSKAIMIIQCKGAFLACLPLTCCQTKISAFATFIRIYPEIEIETRCTKHRPLLFAL
jgi:hypothetical protein